MREPFERVPNVCADSARSIDNVTIPDVAPRTSVVDNQPAQRDGTLQAGDLTNGSLSSASWLEGLQRDDSACMVYTYASTFSTNYTASNLVGAGRILGKMLSRSGTSLERYLGKLAYRAGLGSYAKAEESLKLAGPVDELMKSDSTTKIEQACSILLRYARSSNPAIQIMTFERIVYFYVHVPSRFCSAFKDYFEKKQEVIDVIPFSWKLPGVDYCLEWMYYYKLASRCLLNHSSSIMEASIRISTSHQLSLGFSDFEEILANCRDATDLLLALRFIYRFWDGEGIKEYVEKKGFNHPNITKFAIALIAQCEVYISQCAQPTQYISVGLPLRGMAKFMIGLWESLGQLDAEDLDKFSEETHITIWIEVLKLHRILRRNNYLTWIRALAKTWTELCHEWLPGPERSKLREKLLRLEESDVDA
ncbi:hypothetical protein SCHPADRAFT_996667 [Schizopora paradoxa]|uniref:Uncharacterized protein n=1 Tax=Schizopora paradoxa TaxID=27342 RepID=A0A0H2RR06_9AGAM|nr:hypothetical protein SCHPADRAFT_996667 [Schizopora paradoxa]